MKTERVGCLEIDYQLEFGRLFDGQVRGVSTLEDTASVDADLTERVMQTGGVGHQAAGHNGFAFKVYRWNCIARRQRDDPFAPIDEERTAGNDKCAVFIPRNAGQSYVQFWLRAGFHEMKLQSEP